MSTICPMAGALVFSDPDKPSSCEDTLAQTFCFFRGLTQTLWLEHLQADSEELKTLMVDVAYRTARTKHLQALIAYQPHSYREALAPLKPEQLSDDYFLIKTTKFK
ncbi:MAG: hypothetical protein R2827_00870 [Bdellovibrionales bacterium]